MRFIGVRMSPDCVRGTAKGHSRVRSGCDLANHFGVAEWSAKEAEFRI